MSVFPYTTTVKSRWTRRRQQNRADALRLLGSKCVACGNDDQRVLQINHKFNDGQHHHQADRGSNSGPQLVAKILNGLVDLNRLEILCANCHMIVTYEALYGSNKQ